MASSILKSYPTRFLFLICAIAAAFLIVNYRILIKRDFQLLRANTTFSK